MKIDCIVLAAGKGSRFGAQKMLATLPNGQAVLTQTLERIGVGFRNVIVVIRDEHALRALVDEAGHTAIVNPTPDWGLASSLVRGLEACKDADAVVIALGDMPFIDAGTVAQLRAAFAGRETIVMPTFKGRRGHPVLFGRSHFPALRLLRGDQGARSVIDANANRVIEVPVADAGVFADVDQPGDLLEK